MMLWNPYQIIPQLTSLYWFRLIVFSHSGWDFLDSWNDEWFSFYYGFILDFEQYAVKLWVLFKCIFNRPPLTLYEPGRKAASLLQSEARRLDSPPCLISTSLCWPLWWRGEGTSYLKVVVKNFRLQSALAGILKGEGHLCYCWLK